MLNKHDINRLKSGIIPHIIEGEPFIIMRERLSLRGSDNGSWQWSINTSRSEEDVTIINREEALEIIQKYKMSLAYSAPEGQIYEIEGRPFEKMYAKTTKKAS